MHVLDMLQNSVEINFKNPDWYWVSGQVGTILALNDYFIDF